MRVERAGGRWHWCVAPARSGVRVLPPHSHTHARARTVCFGKHEHCCVGLTVVQPGRSPVVVVGSLAPTQSVVSPTFRTCRCNNER